MAAARMIWRASFLTVEKSRKRSSPLSARAGNGGCCAITDRELQNWTPVLRLLVDQAVPERKVEVAKLWARYNPRLVEVRGERGVTLEDDKNGIRFVRKELTGGTFGLEASLPGLITLSLVLALFLFCPNPRLATVGGRG